MGAILAVDPGTVRVGLAISDEERRFAFPLEVVPAKKAIDCIRELITERGISKVVVGMPMTLDGEIGPEGERVQGFIRRLEKRIAPVPVTMIDERLSSAEADRYLDHPGDRGRQSRAAGAMGGALRRCDREHRDAVAASVILERYLKMHAHE